MSRKRAMPSAAWRCSTGGRCEPTIGPCGPGTYRSVRVLRVNHNSCATKYAAPPEFGCKCPQDAPRYLLRIPYAMVSPVPQEMPSVSHVLGPTGRQNSRVYRRSRLVTRINDTLPFTGLLTVPVILQFRSSGVFSLVPSAQCVASRLPLLPHAAVQRHVSKRCRMWPRSTTRYPLDTCPSFDRLRPPFPCRARGHCKWCWRQPQIADGT